MESLFRQTQPGQFDHRLFDSELHLASSGLTMPSTRVLQGVVHNALETYLSRYSSYDGYWLFGFLVSHLDHLEFDLLAPQGPRGTPVEAAQFLAVQAFRDQLAKAGLGIDRVRNAALTLQRGQGADVVGEPLFGRGWELHASLQVEAVTGHSFHAKQLVCVAAHDPQVERRSAGAA